MAVVAPNYLTPEQKTLLNGATTEPTPNTLVKRDAEGEIVVTVDTPTMGLNDLTDVAISSPVDINALLFNGETGLWVNGPLLMSHVDGLTVALNGKSSVGHVHSLVEVNGLTEGLEAKADSVHTHAISQVTDLQTGLDGKAPISHIHAVVDVTGLLDELDQKAATIHSHAISEVTNLQDGLDAKADSVHTHEMVDVNGLTDVLATKSPIDHAHALSNLTDVTVRSPSDKQVLTYDSETSTWVNAAPTGGTTDADTVDGKHAADFVLGSQVSEANTPSTIVQRDLNGQIAVEGIAFGTNDAAPTAVWTDAGGGLTNRAVLKFGDEGLVVYYGGATTKMTLGTLNGRGLDWSPDGRYVDFSDGTTLNVYGTAAYASDKITLAYTSAGIVSTNVGDIQLNPASNKVLVGTKISMTGNDGVVGLEVLNATTVHAGTLAVTSTDVVENLNADTLDGQHSSDFLAVDGTAANSLLLGNMAADTGNTPTTIVQRDASGNFSAGTISAHFSGSIEVPDASAVSGAGVHSTNAITICDGANQNMTLAAAGHTGIAIDKNGYVTFPGKIGDFIEFQAFGKGIKMVGNQTFSQGYDGNYGDNTRIDHGGASGNSTQLVCSRTLGFSVLSATNVKGRIGTDSRVYFGAPNTAVTDANVGTNMWSIYADESTNALKIRFKNSSNALATATIGYGAGRSSPIIRGMHVVMSDGVTVIPTGVVAGSDQYLPTHCTIVGWVIKSSVSCSAVVDVEACAPDDPSSWSSIAGEAKPTLSAGTYAYNHAIAWNQTAYQWVRFNVLSNDTAVDLNVSLIVEIR